MQFIKFVEENEWEGETWTFWLQVDGNEEGIDKLRALLAAAAKNSEYPLPYELGDKVKGEVAVDELVEDADDDEDGYMPAHNKVVGVFRCPDDLGENADKLYKGQITDCFTAVAQ